VALPERGCPKAGQRHGSLRVRNQSQERHMTHPTPSSRPPGFYAWIVGLAGVVAILLLLFVLVS